MNKKDAELAAAFAQLWCDMSMMPGMLAVPAGSGKAEDPATISDIANGIRPAIELGESCGLTMDATRRFLLALELPIDFEGALHPFDHWYECKMELERLFAFTERKQPKTDTKNDKLPKNRKRRNLSNPALKMARLYKANKGRVSMTRIVFENIPKGSEPSPYTVYRELNDHPELWKNPTGKRQKDDT